MTQSLMLVAGVIAGMPWWVWGILVYLLFVGIDATRDQVVFVPKLFIIPTILFWVRRHFFATASPFLLTVYFGTLLLSGLLQYLFIRKTSVVVVKEKYSVKIEGTYTTLALLMVFFWAKCIFGYLHSEYPALAAQYFVYEVAVNALIAGNFLGRAGYCIQKIWQAK